MAIPEDIIGAEILPRLPLKSLLKFRCVSKSWCVLISDNKDFIRYMSSIIASVNYTYCKSNGKTLKHCPLSLWLSEPNLFSVDDFKIIDTDFTNLSQSQAAYVCLVGSSNGLCCIRKGKQFSVWNPATKISYTLPDLVPLLNTQTNRGNISYRIAAGFGFNEATNHYKILLEITHYSTENIAEVYALLYSSRTNSWKVVENFEDKYYSHSFKNMKFLNGNLHWQGGSRSRSYIYSFDLEREVIGLVEQPNYVEGSQLLSLGILDGCLSCTHGRSGYDFQVRIMKSYGVTESWHLVASITTDYPYGHAVYTPICLAKDGGILFSCNRGFMIYDPRTKAVQHLEWNKDTAFVCADIYVKSLTTPVPVGALTT